MFLFYRSRSDVLFVVSTATTVYLKEPSTGFVLHCHEVRGPTRDGFLKLLSKQMQQKPKKCDFLSLLWLKLSKTLDPTLSTSSINISL